jgi:hypothetical protein
MKEIIKAMPSGRNWGSKYESADLHEHGIRARPSESSLIFALTATESRLVGAGDMERGWGQLHASHSMRMPVGVKCTNRCTSR